ncbi:MAG: hypothetical protein EPN36_16425 [Rhodanobacteraceae bacterium]|nr:MAG: hypothetical protein EPN36_16425 [Rhodanobacteraceae bacterium]
MKYDPGKDAASLAAALRALPASAPTHDAWPELAARIRRRHVARRAVWFTLPAAFAAGIALALAWPHLQLDTHASSPARIAAEPATHPAASTASDIATLQASSSRWQAWVQKLDRDGAPLDGAQLAKAVALQDQIGLVDLQLSAASKPSTTVDLWQQRVVLLQQLGLLHLQPYAVAEQAPTHSSHVISL